MPSELPVLAANLGLLVAVFVGGFVVERLTRADATRRALPRYQQWLVVVAAFSPLFYLVLREEVAVGFLDGTVLAIAVFVGLWLGLPLLFASLFEVEPGSRTDC